MLVDWAREEDSHTQTAIVGFELELFKDHLVGVGLENRRTIRSFGQDEGRVAGVTLASSEYDQKGRLGEKYAVP
jgi:hypothetical protein